MRLIAAFALLIATAAPEGRVRGTVTDESGGVLPGVAVTAAAADGRVVGTAVSDSVGTYVLDALPIAGVKLTFQLDGFSTATTDVAVSPNGDVRVMQKLAIAARNENVTVVGAVPVALPPPAPPVIEPPPAPPAPSAAPIVEHAHDSVCGPAKLAAPIESFGTIRSGPKGSDNGLYVEGDHVIINAGTADGLEVGQNFAARRQYRVRPVDAVPIAEHTAGVVQIISAAEHDALAVVVYSCDELMKGDELAAFRPEPARAPEAAGVPAYDDAARILFADRGQLVGGPRRLMVIDRGRGNGIHVAQRLTLFRRTRGGTGAPLVVGDAIVVAVRDDSATIRVERATDVIVFGDFAAPQRHPNRGTR